MMTEFLAAASIGLGVPGTGVISQPQGQPADPVAIPTRSLLCRPIPPGPPVPGVVVVTIVEEPPDSVTDGRTFTATYDTLGAALSLLVTMHERIPPDTDQLTAIGVQFGPSAQGMRAVGNAAAITGASGIPAVPPTRESLTGAEIDRARQLAEWLWAHRCRKQ